MPGAQMAVFKTYITINGAIAIMDTVEIQGRFFLVPQWFDLPAENKSVPERLVPLDQFDYSEIQGSVRFVVERPVPKRVFDCADPSQEAPGYEVILGPQIQSPSGSKH